MVEFEKQFISNIGPHSLNKYVVFLKTDTEFELVKRLSTYPDILYKTANEMKPSLLCRYLIDLSQKFNEFYHSNPVLNAEKNIRDARLTLIYCIQSVLKSGMKLLNIVPIEEM